MIQPSATARPTARTRASAPRRWQLLVAGTAAAGLLVGCGQSTDAVTSTQQVLPGVTDVRAAAPAPAAVQATWPLTGVAVDDAVSRPALSVKIENSVDARPQTGLDQTDVVFEEVVEGGITRFIAVYHSQSPKEIGPIRSVRPMDANVVAPMGGLLAYSGGQSAFLGLAPAAGLQVLSFDAGNSGFYRVSTRYAPHNVYGSPETFWSQAKKGHKKAPSEQFGFATEAAGATAATAGTAASKISVSMSQSSNPRWSWDEKTSTYLRSEGSTPAVTASGDRLGATNVVVLSTQIVNTRYKDPAGNPVPETKIVGDGKALVATGGKVVEGTWSKKKQDAPIVLEADGHEVQLAPGNTWVELMPSTRSWTVD